MNISLQLMRGQTSGALRRGRDDDLRAGLAVLDDEGFGDRGEREAGAEKGRAVDDVGAESHALSGITCSEPLFFRGRLTRRRSNIL